MIKSTTAAPRVEPRDRDARERPDNGAGPSFASELENEVRQAPLRSREPNEPRRPERDTSRDTPQMNAVHDPRALDPRTPVGDADQGDGAPRPLATSGIAGTTLESASLTLTGLPQAASDDPVAAGVAAEPDLALALPEAAEEVAAPPTATVAAPPAPTEDEPELATVSDELDPADALEAADAHDDDDAASPTHLPAQAPTTSLAHRAHVTPIDHARPLADQVADAVAKMRAESADAGLRSEVVRFRSADFSFSAIVRQDAGTNQVRLVADDPNTRAFLGDRLPEVRQALERVGFAGTNVSVTTGDRQQSDHRPPTPYDPRDPREPGDAIKPARPVARDSTALPDAPRSDRQGLSLIL